MTRNISRRSVVAIFFATASLLRADPAEEQDSGYLALVGPSPLRFSVPEKPFKSLAISPRNVETTDSSEENPETTSVPESNAEGPETTWSETEEPDDTAQTSGQMILENHGPVAEPTDEPVISPQMFLKYFNRSQEIQSLPTSPNSQVQFQAPPPAMPSSKATYSVSP